MSNQEPVKTRRVIHEQERKRKHLHIFASKERPVFLFAVNGKLVQAVLCCFSVNTPW